MINHKKQGTLILEARGDTQNSNYHILLIGDIYAKMVAFYKKMNQVTRKLYLPQQNQSYANDLMHSLMLVFRGKTILYTIETESQQLEQAPTTPESSAKLRAYDLLYSEIRPRMMESLNSGRAHEMAGRIPDAIKNYEDAVADQIPMRFPYEHLRVIYRRQEQYADALRVCQLAIANPYLSEKDHQHFQKWEAKFKTAVSP